MVRFGGHDLRERKKCDKYKESDKDSDIGGGTKGKDRRKLKDGSGDKAVT